MTVLSDRQAWFWHGPMDHMNCLSGMMGWMMAGSAAVGLLFLLLLVLAMAALIKYLRSG